MKRKLVTWLVIAVMAFSPAVAFADQPEGAETPATVTEATDQLTDDQTATGEQNDDQTETDGQTEPDDQAAADDQAAEVTSGETGETTAAEEEAVTGEQGNTEEPGEGSGEVNVPDPPEGGSNGTPIVRMKVEGLSYDWIPFDNANSFLSYLKLCSGTKIEIQMLDDINTGSAGMMEISKGNDVTLDLNGHILNRQKTANDYSSYDDDWEVIIVRENAKLTIIDSQPDYYNGGYIGGKYNYFDLWFPKEWDESAGLEGGVITGGASENGGGGITIKDNATVIMKGGNIAGNMSYDGGGGIQLRGSKSKFIMEGGKILYNGAYREKGGGIKAENGTVEITAGDICHNWAWAGYFVDGDGGGIYMNYEDDRALYIHGSLKEENGETIRSVNISNNYAENEGGGIYLDEGTSTILNANIENNRADGDVRGDGGGILINDDGTGGSLTAVTGCLINGNHADGDGGGIAITDENYIQIANSIITGNNAGDEGGGIYFNAYGDGCAINGCTITGNKAKRNGGGVHQYDTVAVGGKMIVKDNTSVDDDHNNYYVYTYIDRPYLTITDLSRDSELYVNNFGDGYVVSDGPTVGSAQGLRCDRAGSYFEKINDPTDKHYRYIVQKKGSAPVIPTEEFDPWENVSQDTSKDATNLGYTMQIDESKGTVNGAPVYRGYFRFSDVLEAREGEYYSSNYYYSDGLFFNDPEEYNRHLATLTCTLTLTSGAASKGITTVLQPETQKNRFNYLTQAFSDIGCTNESMYVNDCYMRKPEEDTMGVAMANKTIYKDNVESEENAYLLIPVFVRSYNYGPEWVSNATLGDGSVNDGEAQGFSTSADIVMKDLATYIKTHPEVSSAIENGRAKFWLGGYSRGGAVTNIVSKRVTDLYTGGAEGTSKGNEVFSYCMGTPNAGVEALDKKGGYLNIHNVISKTDIVTYIAPSEMGFKRYGVDHYLPGGDAGEVKATVKKYGPNDSPLTTYSDNTEYPVDYSNSDYLALRKKLLSQIIATSPDMEFDDYFHAAEINYLWGNDYTSWIPIIGVDMITEANYEPLSTKAKFCEQFWARLLKYSANTSNAGSDWAKGDFAGKDSKDYRRFYAKDRRNMFKPSTDYNERGDAATLEEAMSTLIYLAMNGEKELDTTDLVDLSGLASDIALDAYDELIGDLYTDTTRDSYTAWINKIWEILSSEPTDDQKAKGYKSLRDILGDEDIAKLEKVFPSLIATVLDFVNDDYNDTDKGQYLLGTMAYNGAGLIQDHIIMGQWLRADDEWYDEDGDKYYNVITDSSKPDEPEAWLSPAYDQPRDTLIDTDESVKARGDQKLYLRTQPGGAVYYTMKVDGKVTVSNTLYQGVEGITLPYGTTVEVTAYAKAYDQQGPDSHFTLVVNTRAQDDADQKLYDAETAVADADGKETSAQDAAGKAEEQAELPNPDEAVINGADSVADVAVQAAKAAYDAAEAAYDAAVDVYGPNSDQASDAADALAAAQRVVQSATEARVTTASIAAETARKKAAAAMAAADTAVQTPGAAAVNAATAAVIAANEAVAKAQAAKNAADDAVAAAEALAETATTPLERKVTQKLVDDAKKAANKAATALNAANAAAAQAAATLSSAQAAYGAEAARIGTEDPKLPKVTAKKPKAAKKAITVKWKKLTKKKQKKVQKIEVWVCPNKNFAATDTIIKTVSKKKAAVKVKGLKAKTRYYVKVRTIKIVDGVKYVSKWSKRKTIKTK